MEDYSCERRLFSAGISVANFYGNTVGALKNSSLFQRVREREALLHRRPIAEHPRQTLTGPDTSWNIFEKQVEALENCARCNFDRRVFACEVAKDGRRTYLTSHPEVFWKIYSQRHPSERHYYEVIPEYLPCKLYLDLEFYVELNPNRDGERMVKSVVNLIVYAFKDQFELEIDPSKTMVDLTASSEQKFSRHLIFDIPNVAFENNYEAGKFVGRIQRIIDERVPCAAVTSKDLEDLEVRKDSEGKRTSFIDHGVYTKNRNFRLISSSKFGKCNPLKSTGKGRVFSSGKSLFLASLITVGYEEGTHLLTCDGLDRRDQVEKHNIPRNSLKTDRILRSPCCRLEKFVENLVCPGRIRRMWASKCGERIDFDIDSGYRFCANVNRFHKSNHVKFVVDVPLRVFYQMCYDPDCKGYKSPMLPLPDDVADTLKKVESDPRWEFDDGFDLGEFSESDICSVCDVVEQLVATDSDAFS